MRKDVECTFGILKKRWSILKTGINTQGNTADKIWKTCCALHNMLLVADGLDDEWSNAEGGGVDDYADDDEEFSIPVPLRRLLGVQNARDFDGTDIAAQLFRESNRDSGENNQSRTSTSGQYDFPENGSANAVCKLIFNYFCARLVEHFDILFHHGDDVGRKVSSYAYKKGQCVPGFDMI